MSNINNNSVIDGNYFFFFDTTFVKIYYFSDYQKNFMCVYIKCSDIIKNNHVYVIKNMYNKTKSLKKYNHNV